MKMQNTETPSKKPIIIIALVTAACLVGDSMLYVCLPTHWQEAGLSSLWQIGVILSVNRLVRLPLNPVVGFCYTKISIRTGMLVSIVLAALTTAGYGLAVSYLFFIFLRCLWGLAWSFLRLGAYFTIVDYSDDSNRGHNMGLFNGLYRLGSLFGMLLGGFLADLYGLRFVGLLFGGLSLCAFPVVFWYVKTGARSELEKTAGPGTEASASSFSLWEHKKLWLLLAAGAGYALLYQGLWNSTLSYLIQLHEPAGLNLWSFCLAAASLGGVLQALRWAWEPWLAPFIGHLTDGPGGRYNLLIAAGFTAAAGNLGLTLSLPAVLWFGLILVLQLCASANETTMDAVAADAAAACSAKITVMTSYSLLVDLGAAVGPLLAYWGNQYLHPYASCYGAAAIFLCLAVYFCQLEKGRCRTK